MRTVLLSETIFPIITCCQEAGDPLTNGYSELALCGEEKTTESSGMLEDVCLTCLSS